MQSFGDDTLLACQNIETRYNRWKNRNKSEIARRRDGSDLGKYFQSSILLSEFVNNDSNASKSRISRAATRSMEEAAGEDVSDIGKYFEDSILFPKTANKKNPSSMWSISNKRRQLLTQDNQSYHEANKTDVGRSNSEEAHVSNVQKQCDQCSVQQLAEENACDNALNATDQSNNIASLSIKRTSNEENSNVTLSLPLGTQDRCKLASWGLPPNILQKYTACGVECMFAWQMECLLNHKVMQERQNLVYSAPTSAGKTLVAEILLIKTILERKKKVIFILPFVSVVREKMYYFQDLLSDSGIRVDGFMGGSVPPGGFAATHVAIATIEKANSLVNRLMEENDLSSLGAVIIDELHLLGDASRGYLLELLLTKLKYMTIRNDNINIQLIGMSATLPNLDLLAKWLNAELYKTEFRPIPLNEYYKMGSNIYNNKFNLARKLTALPELESDVDNILQLCIETISGGHSILIFCPTKKWCEKLAEQIAVTFNKLGCGDTPLGQMLKKEIDATLIHETLEQLKRSPSGLDNILRNVVSFGIAFHHAGLTMDERDIIEGSFRRGSLRVLIATSTLSSGVNLPARRVIIRSPLFGGNLLNTLTYKQMIGRAGRMGKDSEGESILICKPYEYKAAVTLLSASLDPITSCLTDSTLLIRAFLEAVASEVLYTMEDLDLYINCTLLSLNEQFDIQTFSNNAIKFLLDNEFLLLQTTERESRWIATSLGKACLAASVPPKEGLFLFEELQKARRCFVLDTELHVIYLVTPLSFGCQIGTVDWMIFHELWNALPESERRVGQLVGVEERFLMSAIRGMVKPGKSTLVRNQVLSQDGNLQLNIHKRFYSAMALHDLVKEVPLNRVCKKYNCCRGVLQTLQQSAATYAGMITQFCKQLRWDCMELLVSQFQTRLQFGVCRELLDLLRLPMLNGLRARSLYKQGITSVADLAVANELNVERALYNALPFESEKEYEGEYVLETEKRNKMRIVFVTGRDGLTPRQAAILLVQEARILVQKELGLEQVPWQQNNRSLQTYVEDIKNVCDKGSRVETNVNSLKCTEIEASANKTSIHDKPNEKENNVMLHVSEKVNSGDVIENKKIIGSHNRCLSRVKPALKRSESKNDKSSLNFPRTSTSCVAACSEQLDNYEEKHKRFKADDNIENSEDLNIHIDDIPEIDNYGEKQEHLKADDNLEKSENLNIHVDDIPKKKLKTLNSNELKNINENVIVNNVNSFVLHASTKLSYSRSPSLFDDSLNLDTQICDLLEQNIANTSHLLELDDPKAAAGESDVANVLGEKLTSPKNDNIQLLDENNTKSVHASINAVNSESKNSILLWGNDSWDDSKKLLNKVVDNNVEDIEEDVSKRIIRNVTNTDISGASKNIKTCLENNKLNHDKINPKKYAVTVKRQRLQKTQLSTTTTQSPVANIIVFKKEQRLSVDSNKSDSDDIVVGSQRFESPFSGSKSQTRKNLEKIHQIRSQKVAKNVTGETHNHTSTPKDDEIKDKMWPKTKPKLKEILKQNLLVTASYSKGNIILNSKGEKAIGLVKTICNAKQYETQTDISNKNVKPKRDVLKTDNRKSLLNEIVDWNILNIVKIADNRATFNLFKREVLKQRNIALALHCDMYVDNANSIGSKICASGAEGVRKSKKLGNYVYADKEICGVAISWEHNIAYYISFSNSQESKVSGKEQIVLLKELFSDTALYVKCFAAKAAYKLLYQCCGISAKCRFLDPIVAHWLYTNDSENNFNAMVKQYFPQGNFLMEHLNSCPNMGPGLDTASSVAGECRSATEAVLTCHLTDNIMNNLELLNPVLLHTFQEIEMKMVIVLACMELSGIGVNKKSLQELLSVTLNEMQSLQTRIYNMAGRRFNLLSSKEVSQVLGLCKSKKISASKAVLEKCDNPISRLVILWRKLSATKSKIIYPLLNLCQENSRIHGNCIICTVTGRVSMHEPNLQNVPKDFSSEDDSFTVSVRKAFEPSIGNVMLSADYCQLELRLLTHFSQDSVLCEVMKQQGDIFKSIAAKWNDVTEDEVTNEMRQRTKQLCYGMIYGMGVKTLAENLCITEAEAQEFLESFMNAYPGIYKWLNSVLEEAHEKGYVTTLLGRRRQLPDLKSTRSSTRAQAERQAVNTKVQGSAADIVKKAMINIEEMIRHNFPDSSVILPEVRSTRKLRSNNRDSQQRGGYLVLQLHDELLYEVNLADLKEIATIIQEAMENVCQLTVPLPVKVRVGTAWGDLTDYQLQ